MLKKTNEIIFSLRIKYYFHDTVTIHDQQVERVKENIYIYRSSFRYLDIRLDRKQQHCKEKISKRLFLMKSLSASNVDKHFLG